MRSILRVRCSSDHREKRRHNESKRSVGAKKVADDVRRGGALLSRPGIYKSQVGLKFKLVWIRSETIGNLRTTNDAGEFAGDSLLYLVRLFVYLHIASLAAFYLPFK